MKISIIVPSYNQAQFLDATLDSVLGQDHRDVELIVKDGGSTDGSVDLLKAKGERFQWVSQRDHGQADAINLGLHEASGEILAYLNSDDIYLPGALSAVSRHFEENPDCDILYGEAYHLYADGSIMEKYPTQPWSYERLFETCYLCQPAVFWRRSILERHGVFDERLHFAMDYEYWLRIGRTTRFHHLQDVFLAGSRLHEETKTLAQRVKVHREIVQVIKTHSPTPEPVWMWLKHLASITASQSGFPASPIPVEHSAHVRVFASWLLVYAEELQIPLSRTLIQEVHALLDGTEGAG